MVGVQPVNELFTEIDFNMQPFRQRKSDTVKEYIDRADLVWNRLCDAIRALDGSDTESEVGPFHSHLRGLK
eukprot:6379710-Lingulodinium_polyedra.AAC.1